MNNLNNMTTAIRSVLHQDVVEGYKGIMDFDLKSIPTNFKAQAVERHFIDIKEYKEEQSKRPEHTHYENTVVRAYKLLQIYREAESKRLSKIQDERTKTLHIGNRNAW